MPSRFICIILDPKLCIFDFCKKFFVHILNDPYLGDLAYKIQFAFFIQSAEKI